MNKHYVYCHQAFDLNKGGSVGYISTLYESYFRFGNFITSKNNEINFIFPNIGIKDRLINLKLNNIVEKQCEYINNFTNKEGMQNLINERKGWFREIIPLTESSKINVNLIKSIHIHGAYNFFPIFNYLKSINLQDKVIKILTTHNPYKPELEDMELISRGRIWKEADIKTLKYFYNERDYWAFSLCDALIFPSEYSVEGYFKTWPKFEEIIKNKKIYFCTTGGQQKKSTISPQSIRASLEIPNKAKVLLYLGRFVNVRGYDILIDAAKNILKDKGLNVYFVLVGESYKTTEICDRRWIQIPFTTTPGDYLDMADAIICPNRGSLFDLSMIEILAASRFLICSKVGGYKYLNGKTNGILYCEPNNVESLVNTIKKFLNLSTSQINELSKENYKLYYNQLSLKSFWKNYSNCIDTIYKDFDVKNCENEIDIDNTLLYKEFYNQTENNFIVNKPIINNSKHKVNPKVIIEKPLSLNHTSNYSNNKSRLTLKNRKLRKLIKNPKLFFYDFFKKHFILKN